MKTANKVNVIAGNVGHLAVSRTFTDGQLFSEITVQDTAGRNVPLREVFCTNKLLDALAQPGPKELYLWRRHIFAIKGKNGFEEDLKGTRYSFLHRDQFLLFILGCSIILLPYVAWVIGRKLIAVSTFPKLENGHVAS